MCKDCDYTIHGAQHHFGWDNSLPPALRAEPGSTIRFACQDSSAGQLGPSSTLQSVIDLDFGKINPVSGPVYVEGAKPGDALKITVRLFASLRDLVPVGVRGVTTLDLPSGTSVVDVIDHFGIERRLAQMVLVNGIQISRKWEDRNARLLEDGDVLSVFPPVAGG